MSEKTSIRYSENSFSAKQLGHLYVKCHLIDFDG